MNTYQQFATVLAQLLGADTAVRIRVDGYMPLSIEAIGTSADDNRLISLCHYGEQNGDLMRDPEMVFEVHSATAAAEPLSFQNDYMGFFHEVYRYDDDGKKTHVNTRLKQELTSFARTWLKKSRTAGLFVARGQAGNSFVTGRDGPERNSSLFGLSAAKRTR